MTRMISFALVLAALLTCVRPAPAQPPELQKILADFDITEAEVKQLAANLGGRMGELQQKFQDRFKEPPTLENYREKVGLLIDEVGPSITEIVRSEVRDFLTPDQYRKLETRVLQAHVSMMRGLESSEDPEVMVANMPVGMMQMAVGPPSFLEFTEDQKKRLFELQKRTILDCAGAGLEIEKQFPNSNPGQSPEMMKAFVSKFRPILLRFKREYEKILTDKQRAQIDEIMDDVPDYLWGMLPQNRGKDREWRPGAGSWKPGDGAPEENSNREMKPERPREGPRFPGS